MLNPEHNVGTHWHTRLNVATPDFLDNYHLQWDADQCTGYIDFLPSTKAMLGISEQEL